MKGGALAACILIASLAGTLNGCASLGGAGSAPQSPKLVFKEIWGYLIRGKEDALTGLEPLTHICYFSADVTDAGRVTDTIARPVVFREDGMMPKVFLVITELSNSALAHFSLSPDYGVRPLLIGDICRVSQDFDGVQIDFESVSPDDAQSFWDFLQELRSQLPAVKMLSVALPARTELKSDAYDYSKIAPTVDRVVIMAYDEHWSASSPGPVASLPWCSTVLDFTQSVIDNDKIVMGLPLYGRAWQDKRLARAMGFQNVQDLIAAKNARASYQSELGSFFEYSESVTVKVFYDDVRTLREKLQLYQSKNVASVAFWRIGLGSSDLWNGVRSEAGAPPGSQEW
ncbi:MAG TPA: glycosyl hydrolase family 18 protein [Spirochaetia bacterium]|nr:glycosyl hydrolase family 18 protein [Spirochaetia bacterium]